LKNICAKLTLQKPIQEPLHDYSEGSSRTMIAN